MKNSIYLRTLELTKRIIIGEKRVDVYLFNTNILKAIFSTKTTFGGIYACFKTGSLALIILFLCFVFQTSIQAQDLFVRQSNLKSNQNNSVSNKNNEKEKDRDNTMMIFNSQSQNTTSSKKLHYFALKNNLVYDAALLPNISAEAYLGNQFSLVIEGNWSWWAFEKKSKSGRFYRVQSVGAELRYWINSIYPLHGHAVGVYAMVGDYDIRFFPKNEDSKGWLSYGSWSAGLSYAYSVPITGRVNLEFSVAAGYLGGKYYDYKYCIPHERWERQGEFSGKYFGPTRVGVSLVWLFGSGNNIKNIGSYTKLIKK